MTTAATFQEFIQNALQLRLLREVNTTPTESGLHRFREFAETAYGHVRADLDQSANVLRAAVRPSVRWIGEHDLLALGGLTLVENFYTRLVAWTLDPNTHDSTALVRQQAWLSHAGIDRQATRPATPRLFLSTLAGVPDLVLSYDDFVVVVEAKTVTSEHITPGGQLQSHAYGPAVAKILGRPPDSVETVFLTIDRALPDNPGAHSVSHLGSLLAIIRSMENSEPPDEDVEAGFRSIVTHFAANADRPRRDLRRTIRRLGAPDMLFAGSANLPSEDLRDLLTLRRLLGVTT